MILVHIYHLLYGLNAAGNIKHINSFLKEQTYTRMFIKPIFNAKRYQRIHRVFFKIKTASSFILKNLS
jgi:hypothetical protein